MKKTIRLTESDLMGVIKKVISEQNPPRLSTRPPRPSSNPPKQPQKNTDSGSALSKYLDQTVNLYSDKENKKLVHSRVKIRNIVKTNSSGKTGLKITFEKLGDYGFNCQTKIFSGGSTPGRPSIQYYNTNLANNLSKDFCTTSSGGVQVPKATFAQVTEPTPNMQNSTNTLSESDLMKIVKRTMNEMMDVSSDSEYYQARKKDVSLPGDDLSVLIGLSKKWCEESGYKMGGRVDDISLDECRTVAKLNRTYSYL